MIPDQLSGSAVQLRLRVVSESLLRLDPEGAQSQLDQIPQKADLWEPSLTVAVALLRPMPAYARGAIAEALDYLDAADRALASAPDEHLADCLDAMSWLFWTEAFMGHNLRSLRHAERGLNVARATGQQFILSIDLTGQARANIALGRLAEAARLAEDATEAARLLGSRQQLAFALAQRCLAECWSGAIDAAVVSGEEAVQAAAGSDEWWRKHSEYALALALIHAGRPAEGRALLLTACNGFATPDLDPNSMLDCAEKLAMVDAAAGRPDDAARWAEHAQRYAYPELPGTVGLAMLASAHALMEREPEQSAHAARQAAELLAGSELRLDLGRALLTAGIAAKKADDRDSARRSLQSAAEILLECGADFLHRRAVQEQRRLGVYVPAATGRAASPYGLSQRELEVASLVAKGHTNVQIADILCISVRTVETHLSHIFAKLGVSSRVGVAGKLNP